MNRTRWLLLASAVPLLLVLAVLLSAGLDGGGESSGPAATTAAARTPAGAFVPDSAERVDVGSGIRSAAIFRPRDDGGEAAGAVVVFVHGWGAIDPAFYGAWIEHLVSRGVTVIYPIYQKEPFLDATTPLANTLAALRRAFEELPAAPERLVITGHSAGGALSVDYAASARAAGLPEPAAVFSVYPGRAIGDVSLQLKAVDPDSIAPGTPLLVLAGADDQLVGTRWARRIARSAKRADVTLQIVRDPAVDDHGAPARGTREARRTFWDPLDRLIDETE